MPSVQVPNSSGTQRPQFAAPAFACDCHLHIYDPAFPTASPARSIVAHATASDYGLLRERIGTQRAVVVTPSVYRTDNRVFSISACSRWHACIWQSGALPAKNSRVR